MRDGRVYGSVTAREQKAGGRPPDPRHTWPGGLRAGAPLPMASVATGAGGKDDARSKTWPTLCVAGAAGCDPRGVWRTEWLALRSPWVRLLASLPAPSACDLRRVYRHRRWEPPFPHLKNGLVSPAFQGRLRVKCHLPGKAFPGHPV